jgi:O-methyltransferase
MTPHPQTTQPGPPPHAALMQILTGGMIAGAVSALARLGVPDHLDSGPQSAEDLAHKVGAEPGPLYRLMRATASVGVLAEGPDGKFSQTPTSAALRSTGPLSLRGWATMISQEWHMRGWDHLEYCVRTGKQALENIYGKDAFEFFSDKPETAAIFNHAMTDLSRLDSPAISQAYSFEGIRSIVDVAGGHGLLLATILQQHPHLKGTLYDLASVIEGATSGPLQPVMDRCTLVSGDMFASVPSGADAYIMKHIIHDWPDDLCLKILKSCRQGINPGGKLLVVDQVIRPGNDFDPGKFLDLEMLIFPGGLERSEQQFRDLFAAAGWRLNRIIPTPAGISIVEGVPA